MSLVSRLFGRGGPSEADCMELREHGSDLIDDDSLSQRLRAHLRDCEDCDTWVGTLRATVSLLRGLPRHRPPESAIESVRRATTRRK